jgi:hypothetical protein
MIIWIIYVSLFFFFKLKVLTKKHHVIRGSEIFKLWHKKRDTIICIYSPDDFWYVIMIFFHFQSHNISFLLFTNVNGMNIWTISNVLLGDKYIGLVIEIWDALQYKSQNWINKLLNQWKMHKNKMKKCIKVVKRLIKSWFQIILTISHLQYCYS